MHGARMENISKLHRQADVGTTMGVGPHSVQWTWAPLLGPGSWLTRSDGDSDTVDVNLAHSIHGFICPLHPVFKSKG